MTTPMAIPTGEPVPPLDRVLALAAFTVTVTVLRLPFGRVVTLVARIKRTRTRTATPTEAARAARAARWAGHWFPGRSACLEHSLTAVLIATVHGYAVDWCIGARTLPYAAHAWIEVNRRPVGEPVDTDRPYLVLLRV